MTRDPSAQPRDYKRAAWLRYGAAVLFVGVALALRAAFDALLGDAHPFPFFLAAIAVAAWYGGVGPALLALLLGYLAAEWFFIAPRYDLAISTPLHFFSLAVYAITGLVVGFAVSAAQTAARRERYRTAQVRQERERFRVTLASIGDAVIATDAQGLVTFMNPIAEKLTGWTQQEALGHPLQHCFKIHNELTQQPIDDPVAKVLHEGRIVGLGNHAMLVSKTGQEIPIDDSAAPIRDTAGDMVGTILVFRDVSKHHAAELGMRRLAAIVEGSEDAIIGKDLRGVITNWNKGAERIFGYAAADVVGQNITILIPPDRLEEEQEILARLQRGQRIEPFETIRQTRDGQQIHVFLTISPITDAEGRVVGVSKTARDITKRKRAEEALRESNARNTAILESAIDAIIVIDHESRFLEFNPAAEKMFGFSRSQLIGQSMPEWIVPQRLRARHYQGLKKYLDTGEGPALRKRIELPALRANGQEFPAELAIIPIPGSDPPCFTGFVRDLTAVKQAESALQQAREDLLKANRGLETKVHERTASLQQSLKSMETVLYTIAHDLRAPNRAMQGFAQIFLHDYGPQLDKTARSYVNRISDAALKNDALICDLLEYGRLAHAELPMADIDLGHVVQKVLQDLQSQITATNATVEVAERWPSVWANDSVLNQIITNLLTNAIKFVAPGIHPHIRLWSEPSTLKSQPSTKLFVEDNGVGVPLEAQGRLFQPFERGVADPHYEGTGMGLAIVQKAAERLGGTAGFTSTPGQGSCFWVELMAPHSLELTESDEPKNLAPHR